MWPPESAKSYVELSRVYQRWHLDRSAIAALERALVLDPQCLTAALEYAELLYKRRQFPQALTSIDKALQHHARDLRLWRLRSRLLASEQRWEEALQTVLRALELESRDASLWWSCAHLLRKLDCLSDARTALDKAFKYQDRDAVLAWQLELERALILEAQHHFAEAMEAYRVVVAQQPLSYQAWLGQARTAIALQESLTALACCDRAEALSNLDAEPAVLRGRALEQLHQYQAACQAYEAAKQRHPHDAIVQTRLREARMRWRWQWFRTVARRLHCDRWLLQLQRWA